MNDEQKENIIKNVDVTNKAKPQIVPNKITSKDLDNNLYDNIVNGAEGTAIDSTVVNSFSTISRSRDQVYSLLDMMAEDPIISSALDIYTADVCEPNDNKQIVWAESDDETCQYAINQILDSMEVDKNISKWAHSLIQYGDWYGQLYRNSEFDFNKLINKGKKPEEDNRLNEDYDGEQLNEDLVVKMYSKNDKYSGYVGDIKNPADMFDLTKFGKSYGFIKTHVEPTDLNKNIIGNPQASTLGKYIYKFQQNDVDIYAATEFIHACLEDTSTRGEEEVTLISSGDGDEDNNISFTVKRGQSVLYDSFKVWRELSLLEQSILLNRITKSSVVRAVNIEVGDMEPTEVKTLVHRVKALLEQKSAINLNNSLQNYTNPGPMENTCIFPIHDGKGAVSMTEIGGDVKVGDLSDLDYWKKKLYASLGIPGQYLGDTQDNTGFNGGTSLALISSRYAKTVKKIQNALIQAITDGINLILYDRGQIDMINKFTVRMQEPTTQEEKDRKDNLSSSINNIREIMSLLDGIEDNKTKLEALKSLLSGVITDSAVTTAIQNEIDRLEEGIPATGGESTGDEFGGDFGGGGFGEESNAVPMDLGGEEPELDLGTTETEVGGETPENPEEQFYTNNNGELLNEQNDLPSFKELGMSYTDVH